MSLFTRHATLTTADQLVPGRSPSRPGTAAVSADTAMRHSAVWACLRLRADLLSTMPVDTFRKVLGVLVETEKPPVLVTPGGPRVDIIEWRYSSQVDLDRSGNTIGIITERTFRGDFPARIDLQPLSECTVRRHKGMLKYRIAGKEYDPVDVWHEKQFTVSGLDVGLSPVAYAAWSIGEYLSIQDFALDWFGSGSIPTGRLKNTAKTISPDEATLAKDRFKAAVANRDLFVHGADWEYSPIQAVANQTDWLEAKKYGVGDIARFFGCPGDLIDAAVSTGTITYASITQRNLQFLIMNLGPAITRREAALSALVPRSQFVKFNTDAVLRMDPQARATTVKTQIDSRTLAPSEARALDNRPPFTPEQLGEFEQLFGSPRTQPQAATPSGATS